ncbi:hypothetical protein RRG08_042020 [Elysia crispata]|uniref:Uncharacterized protein n=1 Tax=Elysia crispata TaxID=231223 RepID=A0AAE0Z8R1_9GAST|nr:hypothetical protein RRG08_042020 [Elysia crispata]
MLSGTYIVCETSFLPGIATGKLHGLKSGNPTFKIRQYQKWDGNKALSSWKLDPMLMSFATNVLKNAAISALKAM